MNNYSNMYSYMPSDFEYLNRLYNVMQNQNMNQNMNSQNMPNQNTNKTLQNKLAKQAGDNMNFNQCNYQNKLTPNNLYDVYGGYIRGNMFKDLYNQYKINKPFEIEPMNEQAELLTYLNAYSFAAHDLNLFLDNNPNNRDGIRLFNEYTQKANELRNEYEKKYGPLFVDASTTYPWAWNNSPWPWENK